MKLTYKEKYNAIVKSGKHQNVLPFHYYDNNTGNSGINDMYSTINKK